MEIHQIPMDENQKADFLSKVGSSMVDTTERKITVFGIGRGLQILTITDEPSDWRAALVRYLRGERIGSSKEMARMEARARFY